MEFKEYSEKALATAKYPKEPAQEWLYPLLALCEEVGEVQAKFAKAIRDSGGDVDKNVVAKELGDVLWQLNALAHELGFSLEEVAQRNLDKLADRAARGKISGSGDDR